MQALKERLIREAIEDIEAELTLRAFERQQYLAAIVNGFQPSARALDMALPSRLLQAAARIGRGPLALPGPANVQNGQADGNGQADAVEVPPEPQAVGGPKELPPPEGGTQAAEAAGDTEELLGRIRELRAQEPPLAWKAVAAELGLSEYRLHQLRERYGL
jgi:hypothetical protein